MIHGQTQIKFTKVLNHRTVWLVGFMADVSFSPFWLKLLRQHHSSYCGKWEAVGCSKPETQTEGAQMLHLLPPNRTTRPVSLGTTNLWRLFWHIVVITSTRRLVSEVGPLLSTESSGSCVCVCVCVRPSVMRLIHVGEYVHNNHDLLISRFSKFISQQRPACCTGCFSFDGV